MIEPGDVLAFKAGDVLPADEPLSEWLTVLAMAFNDLALVNDHLESDYDELHAYLYWLRLGVSHFTEIAMYLERTQHVPAVEAYVASLPDEVRARYSDCLAIFNERRRELFLIRNSVFHYSSPIARGEHLLMEALKALGDDLVTIRTGTVRDSRLLFADDVAAAIFTRATGIPWNDVLRDDVQKHVGIVQSHIQDAVTAFMRFAGPALMETISRAIGAAVPFQKVELVDSANPRGGWKVVGQVGDEHAG